MMGRIQVSSQAALLGYLLLVWQSITTTTLALSTTNRRTFVGSAVSSAASAATALVAPQSASADAPAVLFPGGGPGSAYLIKPPFEDVGASYTPPSVTTQLARERIQASQSLSPLNQFVLPLSELEIYYPSYMFGSWKTTATLKRKKFPFGRDVVPRSLIEGSPRNREEQVGDRTTYEVHYFSTLANTVSNQVTVNLGLGMPQSKIIPDRAFNAIALSRAYQQLVPVQEVQWDYRKDPTKLTLGYGAGALADDMRPLGQRRGEVYITARASEQDSGSGAFCAAERTRAVTLAPGNVLVSDSETITEFRPIDEDHVMAVSRIAVYLTPNPNSREGVLWQQVGGKAVAFFDYELEMTRLKESFQNTADGSTMERACVPTPKDVIQCG